MEDIYIFKQGKKHVLYEIINGKQILQLFKFSEHQNFGPMPHRIIDVLEHQYSHLLRLHTLIKLGAMI